MQITWCGLHYWLSESLRHLVMKMHPLFWHWQLPLAFYYISFGKGNIRLQVLGFNEGKLLECSSCACQIIGPLTDIGIISLVEVIILAHTCTQAKQVWAHPSPSPLFKPSGLGKQTDWQCHIFHTNFEIKCLGKNESYSHPVLFNKE